MLSLRADATLDRVADFLRQRSDLRLIRAFDHHAREHLGSRVSHQQATAARETLLGVGDQSRDIRHLG